MTPDGDTIEAPFCLHVYPPEGSPSTVPVYDELLIGRDGICDVVLEHPTVSGHHALLTPKGGAVSIRDLGSTNGTTVDEEPANGEVWIRKSAVVRIGDFRLDLVARSDVDRTETARIVRRLQLDARDRELIDALLADWREGARLPAPRGAASMAETMHCSRQEVNRRVQRLETKLGVRADGRGPERYRELAEELLRRGLQPGPV
ncbi:MAG TPA: FHA domain-containing protein [Solirubrobacterales bacterium]|nr:FHA domain-containing protein [Solirubrobacterales bacterium]